VRNSDLWQQYAATHDPAVREQLILQHAPLVKYIVGRLAISLPPSLEQQDLIGYGLMGLIDAVDRFDPGRGVKFETYALNRIRGHILDELRALDLLPRSARRKAQRIRDAIGQLEARLHRHPSHDEIAAYLGMDADEFGEALVHASCAVLSLDSPLDDDSGNGSLSDTLTNPERSGALDTIVEQELRQRLSAAIGRLPEREKLVLALYYYEELTMKEVAQVMEISESRVCQLHAKAILTLRAALDAETPEASHVELGISVG